MGFDEALARLIHIDQRELADFKERVSIEAKAVEKHVEEQTADIRSGGRRFRKPFRP